MPYRCLKALEWVKNAAGKGDINQYVTYGDGEPLVLIAGPGNDLAIYGIGQIGPK